ncbi:MAG: hypothetical protein ACTFAK_09085 [Candidatus Electronema sp. VV]
MKKIFFMLFSFLAASYSDVYAGQAIEWIPSKLEADQLQGTVKKYVISFIASNDLKNVHIRVVPELEKFISVLPESLSEVKKDQQVNLSAIIGLPTNLPVGQIEGTIQVKDNSGKTGKAISKPLPVVLTVQKWTDNSLPPDPGEAGKQTLLGIDSDNDGVRDDVQIGIAHYYPENENARKALKQLARAIQLSFVSIQNSDDAKIDDALSGINSAASCIAEISSTPSRDIAFISLLVQNSKDRSNAYSEINHKASGKIIGKSKPFGSSCEK